MSYYPLTTNTLSQKDKKLAIKVLKSGHITRGKYNYKVEKFFSKKFNRYALLVNSGSSANLLSFALLTNKLSKYNFKKGDEVIIPSLCWSTSLYPIIQMGLKPVFIDIDINTLNISLEQLEKAINKNTKALMLVHALGNCADMSNLLKILKKNNIILIEDCCEALGSKFKDKYLGTFGSISTFSFYFSHHITSGEGGLILCKNKKDYLILLSLRAHGWSREIDELNNVKKNKFGNQFNFINLGYNMRLTDIQAALLYNQAFKIDMFYRNRNYNYNKIYKKILNSDILKSNLYLVTNNPLNKISWFNFPIILKKFGKNKRDQICIKLNNLGIETRPIISGDFSQQNIIKKVYNKLNANKYPNALKITKSGFMIGISSNKLKDKVIEKLVFDLEKIVCDYL